MTFPAWPGPTDWDNTVEVTSGRLDQVYGAMSRTALYISHNGTSWPARTTVTTDLNQRVAWIGPAPFPTDFQVGPDIFFDTSSQPAASTASYRALKGPLHAPYPAGAVMYPWTGATATWTAPTAAQTVTKADTVNALAGETSYTILSKGDGAFISGVHGARTSFDLTAHPGYALAMWIWVDDPTRLASMAVYIGSSSGNSYYSDLLQASPDPDKPVLYVGGWRKLTFQPGFMNVQGTPVATALNRIAFNLQDDATGAVTVRLSNHMQWEPCANTQFPNGVVSMDFDDTGASVKLATPLLDAYGWRGSLVPIISFIGGSGMLTWGEIADFNLSRGWPVKSHCQYNTTPIAEHAGYTTLTAQQMVDSISNTREAIESRGLWGSAHWAAPNGAYGIGVETEMVRDIIGPYIESARVTQSLRPIGTIPPADPLMLENRSDVGGPSVPITAYTNAGGHLDKIVASKGWGHMTFHSLIASGTATTNQITVADFTTLLASIAAKGIAVLPTHDVFRALR